MIRLQVATDAFTIPPVNVAWSRSLAFQKPATASNVFQNMLDAYGPAMALDDDEETRWATDGGTHQAWLEVDLGQTTQVSRVLIDEAMQAVSANSNCKRSKATSWRTILSWARRSGRNFTRTLYTRDHTAASG